MLHTVNSKLTKEEKMYHSYWMRYMSDLGGLVFSSPDTGITLALLEEFPGSRMMLVSISIAESREKKFRAKVGEYHALRRMLEENQYIKVPSIFGARFSEESQKAWADNFSWGIAY